MTFNFFFFQAEDGIRDVAVTGVQTCALPISAEAALASLASESAAGTPCPARTRGHARVISKPIPTERLIRSPSEGSHDSLMLKNSCKNCTDCSTSRYYPIGWCVTVSQESCTICTISRTPILRRTALHPRPVPLDTVAGPRAAFALKHGLRHEPAFRSFLPPPARRPASAGRPKAGLYLAAIDFRRARFPQLTVSTVVRVAPGVNV